MAKIPLPDEMKEKLVELSECQGMVHQDQYTQEDIRNLMKLAGLGLVKLAWVITSKGTDWLKQ